MNKIGKTTYTLAFIGAVFIGFGFPAAQAVDWVDADITCAPTVTVKLDWPDHFGSDPRFSVHGNSQHKVSAPFKSIERHGQQIICRYVTNMFPGFYTYTVKRQIHPVDGCKKLNPTTLRCKVRHK